jgi:hypothetical protein
MSVSMIIRRQQVNKKINEINETFGARVNWVGF